METMTVPETGFLRLPDVLRVFPVSRSAWWQGVKEGRYPRAVKLGPRTTAWSAEAVRDLIQRTAEGEAWPKSRIVGRSSAA